tara:strand:- start:405 stop:1556 length:1152 start_codon:yes stop_codon:yes gene_type:complete
VIQLEGLHYKTREPVKITVKNGYITAVEKHTGTPENSIAPGLVDLQVNGFKGIDFNEDGLTVEDVFEVTEQLWKVGITTYFPTLITNSDEHIQATLKVINEACQQNELVNKTIQGIHLEGPFLSKKNGPRGAHPLEHIKAPDWNLFSKWQDVADGRIKMITLSPEWENAAQFIQKCTTWGVLVAIGHTAATSLQIDEAVKAGAKISTHLGNATHLELPRHHNYIWDQLAAEGLWASLIADGFHLPENVLKVFLKQKHGKCILVSDCTKFAGLTAGKYTTHIGGEVELSDSGRLFIKDNPQMLAGSAQSLTWCIDHLVNTGITTFSEAIDMASFKPLSFINNKSIKDFQIGEPADFILFKSEKDKMKILQTIKTGEDLSNLFDF